MTDPNLVACENDDEIKYILRKYEKRQTQKNIDTLRRYCRQFKNDPQYKPHNRESFYKYIKDKRVLQSLE